MTVIRMRDYGSRVRAGIHAQRVHDQIAHALKTSDRVRLDFTVLGSRDLLKQVDHAKLFDELGLQVDWHDLRELFGPALGLAWQPRILSIPTATNSSFSRHPRSDCTSL